MRPTRVAIARVSIRTGRFFRVHRVARRVVAVVEDPRAPIGRRKYRSSRFGSPDEASHSSHVCCQFRAREAAMRVVLGALGAFGAAATVVAGTAVGYGTMLGSTAAPCSCSSPERRASSASATASKSPLVREATRREAYDRLAESFDEEIEWHEFMTGIKLMRWWMLRQLTGDVLEVAAGCVPRASATAPKTKTRHSARHSALGGSRRGTFRRRRDAKAFFRFFFRFQSLVARAPDLFLTLKPKTLNRSRTSTGRNLAYYPPGVRLTATDCSAPMVEVCKRKADRAGYAPGARGFFGKNGKNEKLEKRENVANKARVLADARVSDAAASPFASDSFDAVVDTFGLCSFEDPVAALREMSRVCRKGRGEKDAPPGKIYLLEHGRSDWAWLSNILDRHADPHAKRWGCYWNRDILAIVREAGLEIQSVARYHLGTTYVIVAAPPRRRR